ncbi:hypothetical protein, partial [Aquiflexum sp.]|uniref:hypothetical protein n=1 Tax=Aquiflexum sp. TaxID=1872584 RepID=UPI003593CDFE
TRLREDNERWLFIANNQKIYRVNVTCDGLQDSGWSFDRQGSLTSGQRSEMELFEDTATSSIKLAMPLFVTDLLGNNSVSIMSIDSVTGNVVSGSFDNINLGPQLPGPAPDAFVNGLEFSPDGSKLYITHNPSTTNSNPLSIYDYNTQNLTNVSGWSGISNFKNSQIQTAKDDNDNYSLWLASDNY